MGIHTSKIWLIKNTDSDSGSHFTATVIKDLTQALVMSWEYHTPWHWKGRKTEPNPKETNNQTNTRDFHGPNAFL
jgi:hypothetical protein